MKQMENGNNENEIVNDKMKCRKYFNIYVRVHV